MGCRRYRLRILEISQQVTAAHIAPAFSCIEIVDALYNEVMRQQDIFIMSKGHGCLAQYVVLEDLDCLGRVDLDNYCKPGGFLGAHPDWAPEIGIEASTGSLGHGLGIAVGQAYAERLKGSDAVVYCLLSDGECQEGSTWEAAMMAANLGLTNLVAFVDNNDFGGMAKISEEHPALYPLGAKFHAFGWSFNTLDGHDEFAIQQYLGTLASSRKKPYALICSTIKGKGVSYMENEPIWHYRSPNAEEYVKAVEELNK
jgi:transketolase